MLAAWVVGFASLVPGAQDRSAEPAELALPTELDCRPACRRLLEFQRVDAQTQAVAVPRELADAMRAARPWFERNVTRRFEDVSPHPGDAERWNELAPLRDGLFVRWFATEIHTARPTPTEPDRGRWVSVRGLVLARAADGRESPFTWPVPVAVALARRPGDALDPATDLSERSATLTPAITDSEGQFHAHVDVAQLERVPGERVQFQVGLVLPTLEPGVRWESPHRVLPGSVQRIAIDGPRVLSPELAALNAVPGSTLEFFDPAACVRAANVLRAAGEGRAAELLREYVALTLELRPGESRPIAANLDHGDARGVLLTCCAAYEPREGETRPPFVSICLTSAPPRGEVKPDPHYPILLLEGLPYLCAWWSEGHMGPITDVGPHLELVLTKCQLESAPLVPGDDPVGAVDRVFPRLVVEKGELSRFGNLALDNDLRGQTWRALAHLVGWQQEHREGLFRG